jgi:uncharacterized protein
MFGFSLTKLLVLLAVIGAVWYGFKMIGRLDSARKAEARVRARQSEEKATAKRGHGAAPGAREPEAEEMVQCPACKAYVAAHATKNCGRPDCPY